MRLALLLLTLAAMTSPPPLPKGDYIKVEIRGTLRTGIMAIGGETTGTVVVARGATWELDLQDLPDWRARIESLHGRTVLVRGTLEVRPGVELKERTIVRVSSLDAVPAASPR